MSVLSKFNILTLTKSLRINIFGRNTGSAPIISSLNTLCSSFDKKYPDCSAKMNIIEEKIMAFESLFMMEILELEKEFAVLQLGIYERNLNYESKKTIGGRSEWMYIACSLCDILVH